MNMKKSVFVLFFFAWHYPATRLYGRLYGLVATQKNRARICVSPISVKARS